MGILPKNSMRVACLLFSSLLLPLVITKNLLVETQDDVKLAVAPTTKAKETDQNGVKGSKWIKRDQNGVKGSNGKVGMDYQYNLQPSTFNLQWRQEQSKEIMAHLMQEQLKEIMAHL